MAIDISQFDPPTGQASQAPKEIKSFDAPDKMGWSSEKDAWIDHTITGAEKRGLRPDVALSLFKQESDFNKNAKSPTGVRGISQTTLATGRKHKPDYNETDRSNPFTSIDVGLDELADLYKRHGSYPKAIKAYNGGSDPNFEMNVGRHLNWARGVIGKRGPSSKKIDISQFDPPQEEYDVVTGKTFKQLEDEFQPGPPTAADRVGATIPLPVEEMLRGEAPPGVTQTPEEIAQGAEIGRKFLMDKVAPILGELTSGAPLAQMVHGRTEPILPGETEAARNVGTELARGAIKDATLGLVQPPPVQPEKGPMTGTGPTGGKYTIPGKMGAEAEAQQIIRTMGGYIGMTVPLSGSLRLGANVAGKVAPEVIGTIMQRGLGGMIGGGIYGAGQQAGETIGQGRPFNQEAISQIAEKAVDDALFFGFAEFGLNGVIEAISRSPQWSKGIKDAFVRGYYRLNPQAAGKLSTEQILDLMSKDPAAVAEMARKVPAVKEALIKMNMEAATRMAGEQVAMQVEAEAAAAAPRPVQPPAVDMAKPAAEPLFTPEQMKKVTHEELLAMPPEQQKIFKAQLKEMQAAEAQTAEKPQAAPKGKLKRAKKAEAPPQVTLTPTPAPTPQAEAAKGGEGKEVYRGGDEPINLARGTQEGISVTTDKSLAENFMAPENGVLSKAILPADAKILKESEIPKGMQDAYLTEAEKLSKLSISEPDYVFNRLRKSVLAKQREIVDYARQRGFDAVEFPYENEIRIIKPNVLKEPSDLAAKYQPTPPPQPSPEGAVEGKKPWEMTKDEFKYKWRQSAQTKQGIPINEMAPDDAKNWIGYKGQNRLKVYRASDVDRPIETGDYVSISKEAVKQYGKYLKEIEVPAKDLRYMRGTIHGDVNNLDFGGYPELIYAPGIDKFHKQAKSFEHKREVEQALARGENVPEAVLKEYPDLARQPRAEGATEPSAENPFTKKAIAAREKYNRLIAPTAHEKGMAEAFPLGAGYGRKGGEKRIATSVNRATEAQKVKKTAEHFESLAKAFDAGKVDERGMPISRDREKRQVQKVSREERITAAQKAREGKEPWEITSDVYAHSSGYFAGSGFNLVKYDHKQAVEKALADGKTVPQNVLSEYPDLQPKTPPLTPDITAARDRLAAQKNVDPDKLEYIGDMEVGERKIHQFNYMLPEGKPTTWSVEGEVPAKAAKAASPIKWDTSKAVDENDTLSLALSSGGIKPGSYDLKNYAPEEQRRLNLMAVRKGGMGLDDLFDNLKSLYPDQFSHFKDGHDWVRSLLDGRYKRGLTRGGLEAWVNEQYDKEAARRGLSPEELGEIERTAKREVAAEALEAPGDWPEGLTADNFWDNLEPSLKAPKTKLSPEARQLKRVYPDISDAQATILAQNPEIRKNIAAGNWKAIERARAKGEIQKPLDYKGDDLFSDTKPKGKLRKAPSKKPKFSTRAQRSFVQRLIENKPDRENIKEAINNTPDAKFINGGIKLKVVRYQKPEQAGAISVRTGVFYLPEEKSPYKKYYSTGKYGYGGSERFQGETIYRRPIFVKAGTGGRGPEIAYDLIEGKGSYEKMRSDVLKTVVKFGSRPTQSEVSDILVKYDGNPSLAWNILEHSKKGNTLAYAIQEHIVAHKIREQGYDSVISYSKHKGNPRLSEVFDVRVEEYPWQDNWMENYSDFYENTPAPTKMFSLKSPAPTFYSQLAKTVDESLPNRGSGEQFAQTLESWSKKGQFKADELKRSGVLPWLREQKGPVTKAQVLEKLAEGQVEVREVRRQTPEFDVETGKYLHDAPTKFQSFMKLPPGGENYREMLLTVPRPSKHIEARKAFDQAEAAYSKALKYYDGSPEKQKILDAAHAKKVEALKVLEATDFERKDTFQVPSSHAYGDTAADVNRFAHVFVDDRMIEGKKYLTIWEMQSDWAAKGRKEGYGLSTGERKVIQDKINTLQEQKRIIVEPMLALEYDMKTGRVGYDARIKYNELHREVDKFAVEISELQSQLLEPKTPPFPFAKNWHEVALKKVLRTAAEEGYDGVAWATGDMVKERYDLAKILDQNGVQWSEKEPGSYVVYASATNGERLVDGARMGLDEIEATFGKSIRQQVEETVKTWTGPYTPRGQIVGENLSIGGEWANRQYDQMMPQFLNKYAKQWGARVGEGGIVTAQHPVQYRVVTELENWKRRGESLGMERPRHPEAFVVVADMGGNDIYRTGPDSFPSKQAAEEWAAKAQREENKPEPIHTLPITPAMRESVLYKGQPLFKERNYAQEPKIQDAARELLRGARRGPGAAEVHQAARRLLEDVKSRGREDALRSGEKDIWSGIEYSDKLAAAPEFRQFSKEAAKQEAVAIPVKNFEVQGVFYPGETPVILVDEVADAYNGHAAIGRHELFHHRKQQGDPAAFKIADLVNTDSPVFKDYHDTLTRDYEVVGLEPPTERVAQEEMAADFVSGMVKLGLDGKPISLKAAFKNGAAMAKVRYQRSTFRPPASKPQGEPKFMAKRPPPGGEDFPEVSGDEQHIKYLFGGFPPGPDTVRVFRKVAKALKENSNFKDISKEEMSMIAQYIELPFWRALENPQFKRVYEVQANRENLRNWANDELLGEIEPAMKWWKSVPETTKQSFRDAVWHFDKLRVEPDDAALQDFGLNTTAIEHYRALRDVSDYIWDEDLSHLLKNLGMPKNDIDKLRRERGKIAGFFPHLREGKYFAHVETKGGEWTVRSTKAGKPVIYKTEASVQTAVDFLNKNKAEGGRARAVKTPDGWTLEYRKKPQTQWFELFDDIIATMSGGKSPKAGKKEITLQQRFPGSTVRFGNIRRMPEEAFWHVDTQNLQAVIDAAVGATKLPEGVEATDLRTALLTAVARTLQKRGFGSHFIPRKDVPGFDKSDPIKSVIRFVQGYNGFKTKVLAAREFSDTLKDIDPKSRDWKFANKYVKDMLANSEAMDQISDKLRGGFFLYFLGGVARQLLLQPTQNFIAFVPAIQQHTKWSSVKIGTEMARAAKDVVENLGRRLAGKEPRALQRRITEEEAQAMEVARKKGILADQLTREYGAYLMSTMGRVGRTLTQALGFFIGNAEKFNRQTAYLVAYRVARQELGKGNLESMKFAEQMVEMAHFRYGKANLPGMFRGGDYQKLFRSSYAFRSYNANLLRLYMHLGTGGTGKAGRTFTAKAKKGQIGILKGLLALVTFGGLSSLYGYKWLEKKVQQETGKNFRSELTRELGGWAQLINYGLPAAVGIDLSGSMSIEAPSSLKEIAGVPAALWDIPVQTGEKVAKGDYYRALETISPSALRGPLKAYRLRTEGMTTGRGKQILGADDEGVKLSPWQTFLRSASFRTTTEAEAQRRREAQLNAKEQWVERRKNLADELRITTRRHGEGSKESEAVHVKMDKFNDDWHKAEDAGIATGVGKFTVRSRRDILREKEGKTAGRLRRAFP